MFKSQWYAAPAMKAADLIAVGQPAKSLLLNNRKTLAVGLKLGATITVSVANLTAIPNDGSVLALYDEVGFMDNGNKQFQMDPRAAGYLTGALMPSARSRSRLVLLTQVATVLEEMVILFFGHPYQLEAWETAYVEQDPKAELAAYLIPNAGITTGTPIAIGAGATIAVTLPTCEVVQYYSLDTSEKPLLRPYVETRDFIIAGAGANQELSIRTDKFVRGLVTFEDSIQNGVRVQDNSILTALTLRSDARYLIGENAISQSAFNLFNDQWQGESFFNQPVSYANFQEGGRIARAIDPRVDVNLKFLVTANPSTVGGATSSRIRVALLSLQRIAGVTNDVVPFLDGAGAVATQ